ncbi:MAG: hypothetical protein EA350_17755 [Gemmatimonadales bacterium]|nr:MAG: hypothetical protein EA350_17755 [Gemmatimonadales bacterium]
MEAMMIDTNVHPLGRDRRGFALPAAIFALVVVALLVTAGFFISGQERSIGQSTEFASQATLLAETGMNNVLAMWSPAGGGPEIGGAPLTTCDGCTGGQASLNGQWQVAISRVGDKIYFIESTGVVNQAGRLSGATRTVGTLARLLTADFAADAALTTRGDVETRGGASISGFDVNPPGAVCSGTTQDKAGVITTPGSEVTSRGNSTVEGAPRDQRRTFDPNDTFRVGELGWDDLVAMADITLPGGNINNTSPRFDADDKCDKEHNLNWGDPERIVANPDCRTYYPIIHVTGTARIQSGGRGQGILLIEGDLDLRGDFLFQGIVMVRGQVGVQGAGNRVFGSMLAANGLEIDPDLSTFVGASVVQYSSCAISNVINNLSGLTALRPVQNRAWVDLTATGF